METKQGENPGKDDQECKPAKRMSLEGILQVAMQEKGDAVPQSATRAKGQSQLMQRA